MTSDLHSRYAEEVAALSGVKSPAVRRALAKVRREDFLPPGPWLIEPLHGIYYQTDDAHPRHVLHGVAVAIDPQRKLNNASPVKFASQMELMDPQPGDTVFHAGAALGYYSALFAELVGPTGRVLAAEIDPDFRERARANLAKWRQVEVIGDALAAELPPVDILYSSAGLGTLPPSWLAALKVGGRMLVPLTDAYDHGVVLLLHRIAEDRPWAARTLSFTRHYPCLGTRDAEDLAAVSTAFGRSPTQISSLDFRPHDRNESCWLHTEGWCLSLRPPD
jgi:protein-L-isoaspartate(D-aspartate) O-methyltransferase